MLCRTRQRIHVQVLRFLTARLGERARLQQTRDWVTDLWYLWLCEAPRENADMVRRDYISYDDFRELYDLVRRGVRPDDYSIGIVSALSYAWHRPVHHAAPTNTTSDPLDRIGEGEQQIRLGKSWNRWCTGDTQDERRTNLPLSSGASSSSRITVFNNLQYQDEDVHEK